MSNYTKATNFASKDALLTGNPLKIVKGTEIDNEFNAISTAVNSKFDTTALAAPGPIGATTPSSFNGTTGTFSGAVSGTTGTFTGNVQMASQNGGQLAGLRNKVINGDMRVAQRGTTFSLTATGAYTVDRWIAVTSVAPSGTLTLNVTPVAITEGTSSSSAIRLAKLTGTFAGSLVAGQAFETSNSFGLAGKTVTISFKARKGSSYTGNALPYLAVVTGTGTDQSANSMLAGTWTGYAVSSTTLTGTLTTSMSAFSATATIPASATQVGVQVGLTYATSTTGSANDFLDITDVQLEVGPVATPFEQRPIGMELALCQRYYYKIFPGTLNGMLAPAFMNTTVQAYSLATFPVSMRIAPASLDQSGTASDYKTFVKGVSTNCSAVPALGVVNTNSSVVVFTVASGLIAGEAGLVGTGTVTGANGYLGWSAEL